MKIINNHIENKLDHIKKILKDKLDQDKTITYYNSPVEIEYRIKNRKKFFSKAVKNKTFPKDIIGFRIVIDSENESLPYNILRNISNDDFRILGFNPSLYRPEDLLLVNFPVPPVAIRPSLRADYLASATYEDDLTHKLADIIKFLLGIP